MHSLGRKVRLSMLVGLAGVLAAVAAVAADPEAEYELRSGGRIQLAANRDFIPLEPALESVAPELDHSLGLNIEAIWKSHGGHVYFEHMPVGYVPMGDWSVLDADAIWASYVEAAREPVGSLDIRVTPLGWIIEPTLDRDNAVAYYALEARLGTAEPVVNLSVYDFGRGGYERITLVARSSDFDAANAQQIARSLAAAHDFAPNGGYADYREGDSRAPLSVAGVIAESLGAE